MRKQALMIAGLGLLLMQGALWSQEVTASQEMTLKIMNLRYYPVQQMSRILEAIYGGDRTQIVVDENTNCLVVRATPDRMVEIERLVSELDRKTESASESESLLCRVYMVELASKQSDLGSFSIVLAAPLETDLLRLLKGGEGKEFQIDGFSSHAVPSEASQKIEIQGRAASNEIVRQAIAQFSDVQIMDMKWAGRTSGETAPAAQISQFPEPLRQHLQKFLGSDLQIVGYWFGGMSSPGKVKAPIGPWSIEMEVRPAQASGLSIEVGVQEWRNDSNWSILENSIQGKVGKPIIIGYNRDAVGTRTMGAMVILLEADGGSGDEPQTKNP